MTDIDFDELDRAVNSLMNQNNKQESQQNTATNAEPVTEQVIEKQQTPASTEATTGQTIAKRPSGRFMDVIRPSQSVSSSKNIQTMPSRTGITLQPPTNVVDNTTIAEAKPESDEIKPESDNLAGKIAESLAASAKANTPFIENPSIEKRPLGALLSTEEKMSDAPEISQQLDIAESIEPRDNLIDSTNSEVNTLAQESTEATIAPISGIASTDDDSFAKEDTNIDVVGADAVETFVEPVTEEPTATATPETEVVKPMAVAGDIPRQYAVEESSEPDLVPMFDSAAVQSQQQLQHQTKKKHGWLTIFLIVLFIALGVGGGAAAYYLLIQ